MSSSRSLRSLAGKLRPVLAPFVGQVREGVMLGAHNVQQLYGDVPDVKVHHFKHVSDFDYQEPTHLSEDHFPNFRKFDSVYETTTLDSTRSDFFFFANFPFDHRSRVIYDPNIATEKVGILGKLFLRKVRRVQGCVAYFSNNVSGHFGHWFHFTLPLLIAYREAGLLDQIDHFYIGDCDIKPFHTESFKRLRLDPSKMVNLPCRGDRAVVAIKHKHTQETPGFETPWHCKIYLDRLSSDLVQTMADSVPVSQSPASEKLYVRRGNVTWRRLLNEAELESIFESRGYRLTTMDQLSFADQVNAFRGAKTIVAVHGSAMLNLQFCLPGTSAAEIFPENYPDPFNFALTHYHGVRYGYLLGKAVKGPGRWDDVYLPADKLRRFLDEFESRERVTSSQGI